MKHFSVLCWLLLIPLSGCFPAYFHHGVPDIYTDHSILEQSKSQNKYFLLSKLGEPDQHLTDGKNEYFIFQDIAGGQTEVIFFMHILLPIASQGGDNLYCLLIVVDDADLIERYEIIEAGNADTLAESDYSAVCREQFWDEEALIKIKTANGAH